MNEINEINELAKRLSGGRTVEQMRRSEQAYQEERQRLPMTEAEREYWKHVFSTQKSDYVIHTKQTYAQEMEYIEARKAMSDLLWERQSELCAIKNNPEFRVVFSDEQKAVNRELLLYFINSPECSLPLHKGIFLYGNKGIFKTEMTMLFEKFTRKNGLTKAFKYASLSEIYEKARDGVVGLEAYRHGNELGNWAFDELGRHIGPVLLMGNQVNILESIIEMQYIRYQRAGHKVFFISNFAPNEVEQMVSGMIADRLNEIVSPVYYPGESKRE